MKKATWELNYIMADIENGIAQLNSAETHKLNSMLIFRKE